MASLSETMIESGDTVDKIYRVVPEFLNAVSNPYLARCLLDIAMKNIGSKYQFFVDLLNEIDEMYAPRLHTAFGECKNPMQDQVDDAYSTHKSIIDNGVIACTNAAFLEHDKPGDDEVIIHRSLLNDAINKIENSHKKIMSLFPRLVEFMHEREKNKAAKWKNMHKRLEKDLLLMLLDIRRVVSHINPTGGLMKTLSDSVAPHTFAKTMWPLRIAWFTLTTGPYTYLEFDYSPSKGLNKESILNIEMKEVEMHQYDTVFK